MPLQIMRNDITRVKADAIVNTANPEPLFGDGTDRAVYEAAGTEELLKARKQIGRIARGEIAVTPAFHLKAKYIIHTVGPVWKNGCNGETDILRSCYRKSLEKAAELSCACIAFPLLAAGTYGFPKEKALQIALEEIGSFLLREDVEMTVKLVVFDDKAFRLSRNLFYQVESFLTDEDVLTTYRNEYGSGKEVRRREREGFREEPGNIPAVHTVPTAPASGGHGKAFNEHTFDKNSFMKDGEEALSFQKQLLNFIIEKNLDNSVVYKQSNVSRGAFSKIMCGDTKIPKKKTVLGFCIGLRLSIEEAELLLASADMAFNPYDKRDKLVLQCMKSGQYDVGQINSMLYLCDQPLLGS